MVRHTAAFSSSSVCRPTTRLWTRLHAGRRVEAGVRGECRGVLGRWLVATAGGGAFVARAKGGPTSTGAEGQQRTRMRGCEAGGRCWWPALADKGAMGGLVAGEGCTVARPPPLRLASAPVAGATRGELRPK